MSATVVFLARLLILPPSLVDIEEREFLVSVCLFIGFSIERKYYMYVTNERVSLVLGYRIPVGEII